MSFNVRARGVTIIELILFMVIMGVAAAGIIGVINLGTSHSADPLRRKQALMIAEALMEEVQQARFTFCEPGAATAATAQSQADCSGAPMQVGTRAAGAARPYGNVAQYATVIGEAQATFAVGNVDRDINGVALGVNSAGTTLGNTSLAPFRSTVTLNYVDAQNPLGAGAGAVTSSAAALNALQITIVTSYGSGANDVVRLDGYRTRYAPTYLP
jgi:MSHA pilin protein MshD